MLTGQGGMVAHLGTNDLLETESRAAAGDEAAGLFLRAMACRIAQEIARHGATLEGTVDLIVITGGMAQEPRLVDLVTRRVRFLAPVEVVPGEREMLSLARAAASALAGQTVVRSYG
jgi:butyrate kinase